MDKHQENKLSMYYAVLDLCTKNEDVWEKLEAFKGAFEDFTKEVGLLRGAVEEQEKATSGHTKHKASLRDAMVEWAVKVEKGLLAYANKVGNEVLQKMLRYSKSSLLHARDGLVMERCTLIKDQAEAVLDVLAPYGITKEDIKALVESIEAFNVVVAAPRAAIVEKKGATAAIKGLIIAIDGILHSQMDLLVGSLKISDPAFHKSYFDTRHILEIGIRHRSTEPEGRGVSVGTQTDPPGFA